MKISNKKSNIRYSFVMGRFSKKIGDKYQHFPIDNWQNEILHAKKHNFDGVEWIISDYSNPIFNETYFNDILNKFKTNKLIINSIYLDLIMNDALHKISIKNLKWIIEKIKNIQKKTKINRITFPIEEKCRFNYDFEKKITIDRLGYILKKLSKKSKVSIETDISVENLKKLLNIKKLKELGLLLDIGNIRANGYNINEYINNFSDKIFGVHIKYRSKFNGNSKILPQKFSELKVLKNNLKKLVKLNDLTFQTFRSDNDFLNDMKKSIKSFNRATKNE